MKPDVRLVSLLVRGPSPPDDRAPGPSLVSSSSLLVAHVHLDGCEVELEHVICGRVASLETLTAA